jgi:hypothetical protein
MDTLLGTAVHIANNPTLHGSGGSLAEILGVAGAALALTVLWIGTQFLPRGKQQTVLAAAQPARPEVAHASRLAARTGRRASDARAPLAR